MANQITLNGCSPIPIASYLKALGVLRLLSQRENSVTGQAADRNARGWWRGMRFHLLTSLNREDILKFFLHHYAPSPVIAPWNGGSGFYPNDRKTGIRHLESAEISPRFKAYADSVSIARDILQNLGLNEKPPKEVKVRLIERLRARLPVSALPWLDASVVLSGEKLRFPPVLGTGGNDGRLDFANNLMQRLFSDENGLFRASNGTPCPSTAQLLENSLYNAPALHLSDAKVGQFSPSGAGGPNAGTGFEGESVINSWDYVFMLEGASAFASVASRRHQSNVEVEASFPFTVDTSGAGWGGIEATDIAGARAEFWAPLWHNPARYAEIKALFGEGRAITKGRMARDGLDFARAISTLGTSRGFSEFQRYGYFKRAGKSYYAVAIGRRRAEPSPGAKLISDLDRDGWLGHVIRFGRKDKQTASIRRAVKNLEEALFELLAPDLSSSAVSSAIVAIGQLGLRLNTVQPGKRNSKKPAPPPLLSSWWTDWADDHSPEFRIAAALAGLGICQYDLSLESGDKSTSKVRESIPPMAAHLAWLTNSRGSSGDFETTTFFQGQELKKSRQWAEGTHPPTAVWGHGGLVSNMIAVLERRLVETPIRGLTDKPFGSASFAPLSDVAAFLTGDFDDAYCNELLLGLAWARPAGLLRSKDGESRVPFAYAALKPIFTTNEMLIRIGVIPQETSIPVPHGLITQLRAGGRNLDGKIINRAVLNALGRARSSGIPSPFDPIQSGTGTHAQICRRFGVGVRPDRLAASLLIPIFDRGMKSLLRRAYPGVLTEIHETTFS
ncbi:MAG: type I-U CRISPR-associated protein Csx17 [Bacteroidota bacterium]|nr:type I-U CRISPR-associated protein Csx17 [Bacteroidota bacterium]MDE2646501.1 type I-U CRISPR-associated protein Csx17 [Bacteroidota bacterium]MXW14287.1 type I-U CRISPR-associated protein Csx17 [Rhodothermaceae bacterium]MYC04938.1 type I-U CRISPR-associated protein Csx17 [Rhodothermaceae bacterium]MYI16649.1 type I-U CRISPR-associated protein Csx17 [Rhodothermaceae bacterium]